MKNRCVLLFGFVSLCAAQEAMRVQGEIRSGGLADFSQLSVQLELSGGQTERSPINPSGAFEFRDVPSGTYTLRVTSRYGGGIASQLIHVSNPITTITISLPDQATEPVGQTVSLWQLQHTPPKRALRAMAKALDLARKGAHQRAVAELEEAIALDPEFAAAHSNLGVQYALLGQNERAIAEFRCAAELNPSSAIFQSNLACVLIWMRQFQEAEKSARLAVRLDNSNPIAHYLLGILLAARPETRLSAVQHLKTAARQFPRAYMILAEVYRAEGQNQLAKDEMRRYVDADPAASREAAEKWMAALR